MASAFRSPLFVPGNRPDMLEKVLGLTPDAYIPDLEDSVPPEEKLNARKLTASSLARLAEAGPLVIPRVNSRDTGLMEGDLEAVVGPHTFGVSVGKVQSAADINHVAGIIERLEMGTGLEPGRIKIVPWIETAAAIVHAYEICSASPRVFAVAFGAEDFTRDMGIERTEDDAEIAYPRSAVCIAARAAGVPALDTPYFGFKDPEGLRRTSRDARRFGFRGKFAIHPSQIDIIREVFSTSAEEIEQAERVVAAFEEGERLGKGATSLDGQLIDVPVVERARDLLERAKAED